MLLCKLEVFVVANHQQRLRLFVGVVDLVEISQTFALFGSLYWVIKAIGMHIHVDFTGLF